MLLIGQWWTILAFCNVGWTVIQMKPLALRDGSNRKQKLKTGKVWKSSEMYLKVLTGRKELKVCTSMKDVTSHSHLGGHFSNLGRERRQKMLKNFQQSLNNKIFRKKNVNHHHLNVYDLQLVDLYIIRINAFGVWKVLTKAILLEKLENWCKYQLFQDGENLKDTRSISKKNYCMSNCLSLLKLYLLFRTLLLQIWYIIFHVGQII